MMIEAKGPGYESLLSFPAGREKQTKDWSSESLRQVQAAGNHDIIWYFAEQRAADFALDLFLEKGKGRERIQIRVVPPVIP